MTGGPKCRAGCGKTLTSQESIERGYGQRCWEKLHGRSARRPRITTPAAAPGTGQPELPLIDQPTLWSP
ncbi:DUF6011 domain-containing protein [Streptomyces aquilus]|uniref:DUF6011 domain-containing protein n=1 Tax=Streptomyces aquilus TaxID=2548456 RepID=UPI0037D3EDD6